MRRKKIRKNNRKLFLELYNTIKVECSYIYLKQLNIFKVLKWLNGKWKPLYSFQGIKSKEFLDYQSGIKGDNRKPPPEFIPSTQQWADLEEKINQIFKSPNTINKKR